MLYYNRICDCLTAETLKGIMRKILKDRRILYGSLAVLLLVLGVCVLFGVTRTRAPYQPGPDPTKTLDPDRSQGYVTGEGYRSEQLTKKAKAQPRPEKIKVKTTVKKAETRKKTNTKKEDAVSADDAEKTEDGGEKTRTRDADNKKDENGGNQKPADAKSPTIQTSASIDNRRKVNGTVLNFWISASDYQGHRIPVNSAGSGNFTVKLNGRRLYSGGNDGGKYSFRADSGDGLKDGNNSIVILVTDRNGNRAEFDRVVIMNMAGKAKPGGYVTFTISAKALGLGTIASGRVQYYRGEQLSYALARFLDQAGLGYNRGSSLKTSFYLSYLSRSGITKGYHIPDAIAAKIGTELPHHDDRIQEKDFCRNSGWVYSINGSNIGQTAGFSQMMPEDGDEIQIMFTVLGYPYDDVDGVLG